jgi:hypothetical protein
VWKSQEVVAFKTKAADQKRHSDVGELKRP